MASKQLDVGLLQPTGGAPFAILPMDYPRRKYTSEATGTGKSILGQMAQVLPHPRIKKQSQGVHPDCFL